MRLLHALLIALGIAMLAAPAGADGFFGITADTSVDKLPNCKPGSSDYYFDCEFSGAPFSKYEINFDPARGVCGITASIGPVLTEDEARTALKTAFAFVDEFTDLREPPRSELREIANGGSGPWFEEARAYDRGPAAIWFFTTRADKLTSMFLSVRKAWLKPGVEIELSGYFANRTLCFPERRTRFTIRELGGPAAPK